MQTWTSNQKAKIATHETSTYFPFFFGLGLKKSFFFILLVLFDALLYYIHLPICIHVPFLPFSLVTLTFLYANLCTGTTKHISHQSRFLFFFLSFFIFFFPSKGPSVILRCTEGEKKEKQRKKKEKKRRRSTKKKKKSPWTQHCRTANVVPHSASSPSCWCAVCTL